MVYGRESHKFGKSQWFFLEDKNDEVFFGKIETSLLAKKF